MFKKSLSFYSVLAVMVVLSLVLFFNQVMAKPDQDHGQNQNPGRDIDINAELPEQAGIYGIKGRPEMKLRVFVHPDGSKRPSVSNEICGLADPDSTTTVPGAGWRISTSTPWVYRLNLNSTPPAVGSSNLPAIAANAYTIWSEAVGNKITFSRGQDTFVNQARFDGQNIVSWGRAPSSALAVSYIWYNNSGLALEVDTILNQKYSWKWSNPSGWPVTVPPTICAYQKVYDAQNILSHEFGHTVGLEDEYTADYQNNTMYGRGSLGETKKDTLTQGDILGEQNLYAD